MPMHLPVELAALSRIVVNWGACLLAWHDIVWVVFVSAQRASHHALVRLSRLVAWSQHDWPGLKDWVTAAGSSPLAAVETASNRCRQCARML